MGASAPCPTYCRGHRCLRDRRGLDARILRARSSFPALLGALLFAALAALALSTWREATSHSVERLVGAVVFLGGLVLAATANEPDDV